MPQATAPEQQSEEAVTDSVMTDQNQQLMGALRNQPDVRPEVVERGKSLAADPDYPSTDIVDELAKLFTAN